MSMKKKAICHLQSLMRSLSMLTIAILLVVPVGVQAGDHWLSRVTVKTPGKPDITLPANLMDAKVLNSIMTTSYSNESEFDITISLEANPQGDNNYIVKGGANDADQRAYEDRIEEFAKAVYQSTNGAHKIGTVTIYRDGKQANSVDVLWNENCPANQGPRANMSGFGVAGQRIWMCTNWTGSSTMSTAKGGGYTMAHEWGHYAYGLYDEYAQEQCPSLLQVLHLCPNGTPRAKDTAAVPAIMNNQWNAVAGDRDYLEFSTQNIHPYKTDSKGTNAQKRVWGESAWETLTRDSATDSKWSFVPKRTQYTTLTAPADPNWIVANDESTALSELKIRWIGDQLMDLSIDRSGSMAGTPLANAKTGANLLIDQIQPGAALGVSSFETNVARNFAITNIPDPDTGVKASAKAAVNALTSTGMTSMNDGLMLSLNDLKAFDTNRAGVVFLLSDGGDNDSTATEAQVISAYQAAGVPIIAFAYGSFAPTGTLLNLANSTGGAFFQSPTTLPEIQASLLSADAKFSDNVMIDSARASAPAGTTTRTIPLDSTLASVLINLSYTGNQTDFNFSLLRPNGTDSGVIFTCNGSSSCSVTLDETFFASNGYGDYRVQIVNNIGTPKDITVLVSAMPSGAESYDIAVGFSSSTVNYPADMAIRATVTKGGIAVTGLAVVAKVTGPSGNVFDVPLLDDGMSSDILSGDGTYSSSIHYTANGIYSAVVTASNAAGNAHTTFEKVMISLREDGTAPLAPPPVPVTENFVRVGTASAIATGVIGDDYANNPASGTCKVISDNNADTLGRIDNANDVDCFTFVPSSTSAPIVVRVTSLTSGMDPVLTIYDNTGVVQITEVNMLTSENPTSGVVVTIAVANLDAAGLVFTVRHTDTGATIGGYAVSAGASLISDIKSVNSDESNDGIGNIQGGGSCFIATAAYGSYFEPHVKVLRDFRDSMLLTNKLGKVFVKFYYSTSPPIADYIAKHEGMKMAVRWVLTPLVYGIKYPGIAVMTLLGLALIPVMRRKRAAKKVLPLLLLSLLVFAPWANAFDAHTISPKVGEERFVNIESTRTITQGKAKFGIFLDYAENPVGGTNNIELLERQTVATASAGYGLSDALQVSISIPYLYDQRGRKMDFKADASSAGFGDFALSGKYRFAENKSNRFGLGFAVSPYAVMDTGASDEWFGSGTFYGGARLVVDKEIDSATMAAFNIGYQIKETEVLTSTQEIGDTVFGGLGISHDINDNLFITGEAYISTPSSDIFDDDLTPMEGDISLGFKLTPDVQLIIGAGAGSEGIGAPDWRFITGVRAEL